MSQISGGNASISKAKHPMLTLASRRGMERGNVDRKNDQVHILDTLMIMKQMRFKTYHTLHLSIP